MHGQQERIDARQKRREMFGMDKPVQKSNTTSAGSIVDSFVPSPGNPQNPNHQALNPLNMYEQPAGSQTVDGQPYKMPFGDMELANDGRAGYVSAATPPSGTRQGMMGFRGQNMVRDGGQLQDTDASAFDKLDMDYHGMQAMDRANKNYAAAQDRTPSYNIDGLGMSGTQAMAAGNPQLQEPPPRIGQELGLQGVQSAQGISFGQPVGNEMVPGSTKTTIRKQKRGARK